MKFSKFILAFAASILILSQAGAATIVGNLMDIYGGGIDRTIKISPKSTPQAVIYNGTNYTVMDLAKTVSSTNSVFSVVLLGGIYNVDFGTVNGVATPVTKILVPPYDTNTYSFNFVANLATNLGTFVWTNSYGIAAGTNIVITTNGALLVINASAPAAPVPTNFASIIVTNDINRGTNATGTGATGGNGLALSISSGGSPSLSPGTGGNGGTVSISAGQNGNGTLGHGGVGGTVSIGQGGYGSSFPGTGGTVSIANGGGGQYGTGTGGTVNIATNGGSVYAGILTAFGNFTTFGNADIQGTLFNSTGTLNINQTGNSIDGAGINIQSGGGDNAGPNSPGGTVSIATGTSYGAQNNAADLSIQAGNGYGDSSDPAVYGRGSDVNIAAGTGSGGYRDGKINLNGTVTVLGSISGNGSGLTNLVTPTNFASITVTNSATMLSNVFIADNLYVTNHAYDVSTSRLDPLANEFVTAEYVQSVMAANFDLYFSTNSSGISITNVGTPSTMVVANSVNSQTNTISSFTNGTYFTARLQTNSISYIQSVPINLYTYVQITGGGSVTAHPEMWLYNTNGTIVQLGYSSDNTYSSSISVPVNLAIAMTNTDYLNVNLTNSPQLLLRWYVTSKSGNPTWRFLIGNGNVTHITVGTIPSANQNYVGTFTGNGTGLTNIPSTGITGLGTAAYSNSTAFAPSTVTNLTSGQLATIAAAVTNNASPTLTGLSVGAQTALDVNGNGKVGGVGLTNGVLTGNGSGLTNIKSSAVVATNIITYIGAEQFADGWNSYYLVQAASYPAYFTNSSLNEYAFALNSAYTGFGLRISPQMTYGYTNLNITVYFVASKTTVKGNFDVYMRYQDLNSFFGATPYVALNVGTFTNGINPRTCTFSINPNTTAWYGQLNIATGSGILTNQIHCMGVKLEAY